MILSQKAFLSGIVLLSLLLFAFGNQSHAQRARFDDFFALQNPPQTGVVPQPPSQLVFPGASQPPAISAPAIQGPVIGQPLTGGPIFGGQGLPTRQLPPPGTIVTGPLGGFGLPTVAPPAFDPYSTPVQPFPVFPRAQSQVPLTQPRLQAPPTQPPSGFVQPPNLQPQTFQGPNPAFNFGTGVAPTGGFGLPNRWPYQGTGTNWLPSIDWSWANNAWYSFRNNFLPRVLERPRARQTWIHGSTGVAGVGNELNINELELATTATWPRFLGGPVTVLTLPSITSPIRRVGSVSTTI